MEISDYNPSCIIYVRDSKLRIRNYKNFLIYLTNYYYLINAIDKTNLTFEKLFRKLEILLQNKKNTDRKIAKSVQKDAKDIFKIIKFSKISKTSFKNIVSIVIEIVYKTEVFGNIGNIEIAHQ